jgi:DNA invertase Pin-like site-specific DNA recombinase
MQMLIGYARVSTDEQSLALQQDALKKAGCEKIFEDTTSGSRSDRPGLNTMTQVLRKGDTLVVWKLDRLGRSLKSLIDYTKQLEEQGIHFKSLTDQIDTSTPAGRFFFHVMASLAQMERELIIERTKAGLAAAKREGRTGGRKRKMTDSKLEAAKRLLASGRPPKEVAENLGVSIPTLYRWLPASLDMKQNTQGSL